MGPPYPPAAKARPSRGILRLALLLASLLTACSGSDLVLPGGDGETGGPMGIRVVTGDGQTGEVGRPLALPLVIEVTDADGVPAANVTVQFELTSAGTGAAISPATATTNTAGLVEAQVLLGNKVGIQTGEARVVVGSTAGPKISFSAVANPPEPPDPSNQAPRSDYNWHCEGLSCQFTDASTDDDGSVTSWSWRFRDGGTSELSEPNHIYPGPGTYLVALTVSDDDGATDEATAHVDVDGPAPPESNEPPDADFQVECADLTCAFSDRSKDEDGAVVGWEWRFGDDATSTQQNPVHTYAAEGKYDVLLIITDNRGATDTKTRDADAKD